MSEHNAVGTRVALRPLWVVFVLSFITSGLSRIFLAWRLNADLAEFGRAAGTRLDDEHAIVANPAANAVGVALLASGAPALLIGVLLASSDLPAEYGTEPSSTAIAWFIATGVAGVAVGIASFVRTAARLRAARRLAGLPPTVGATGRWFLPVLAAELVGVPGTSFALQASANDLWARYPPLLDEDLHGEFAPPARRDAAVAERPGLHEARLARIADELEQPRLVPWVTIGFTVLCIAVFAWQLFEHGPFPTTDDLERVGGLRRGIDGTWWRFWTANVLHGSVDHLAGNMFAWVLVAAMAERVVGHLRMAALVVAGAAGCSAGALYADPGVVGIGASGVVFAAFGLAAMVDPRARRPVGKLGWSLVALGLGLSTFVPGVSSGGHVGGVLAGVAFGLLVRTVWRVRRPAHVEPAAALR
ncbi:MAG: Rhomboid family protein, partial [Thermoleophilia bacterium]|nr:Rhomboid family protein [Thermoleophilia bacterium]